MNKFDEKAHKQDQKEEQEKQEEQGQGQREQGQEKKEQGQESKEQEPEKGDQGQEIVGKDESEQKPEPLLKDYVDAAVAVINETGGWTGYLILRLLKDFDITPKKLADNRSKIMEAMGSYQYSGKHPKVKKFLESRNDGGREIQAMPNMSAIQAINRRSTHSLPILWDWERLKQQHSSSGVIYIRKEGNNNAQGEIKRNENKQDAEHSLESILRGNCIDGSSISQMESQILQATALFSWL
jgi:hypothetical protein